MQKKVGETVETETSNFIPLKEAAALERVSMDAFRMRMKRNPQNFKYEADSGALLVSLDSLSIKAQNEYQQDIEENEKVEKPWYVDIEPYHYQTMFPGHYREAKERLELVIEYNNYQGKKNELYPKIKVLYGLSKKGFLAIRKRYVDALEWKMKKEIETGYNHDEMLIIALARQPRKDKGSLKVLSDDHIAYIENIYYSKMYQQNKQPVMLLYKDFSKLLRSKDLPVPCYETVRNFVNTLDKSPARKLAVGKNKHDAEFLPKGVIDKSSLMPLDLVEGDAHTMDFYAKKRSWNGDWITFRPKLVAWQDVKTRTLLGWLFCEDPGAMEVAQSFIQMVYPKKNPALPYGLPRGILIDNGREYKNKFTKGLRSFANANEKSEFEEVMNGFYLSIGVEDIHHSTARCPWSKGSIERFFGTVENQFGKRQPSYTGTLSGSSTENKIQKDIKKMNINLIPTMEELNAQFETYILEEYHMNLHGGLREDGELSFKPIELWDMTEKYFKAAPPIEYAFRLISSAKVMKVTTQGIKRRMNGESIIYAHPELQTRIGMSVQVFMNPLDITKIDVYDTTGKKICVAQSAELMKLGHLVDEDQMAEHMRNKKRINELANKKIAFGRLSPAERKQYESFEEFNIQLAGKSSAAPELSEDIVGITALPVGKRFREDHKFEKATKAKTEKKTAIPDLFEERGQQVYERMMKQAK